MEGPDVQGYTLRFNNLARLVPRLVTPEYVRIERYIEGLAPQIKGMVTSSHPTTMRSAVTLEKSLTEQAVRMGVSFKKGDTGKKSVEPEVKLGEGDKGKKFLVLDTR